MKKLIIILALFGAIFLFYWVTWNSAYNTYKSEHPFLMEINPDTEISLKSNTYIY